MRDGKSLGAARAVRWWVFLAFTALVVIGFSNVLVAAWEDVQDKQLAMSWQFVAAWLLFGIAVVVSGALWGRILSELEGRPIPRQNAVPAHCVAWLLKYIPGQVGALLYKVAWARKNGISGANAALSFLYESIFLQLASLVPGLITLALFADALVRNSRSILVSGIATVSAIIVGLTLLGPALRWATERLEKQMDGTPLRLLSTASTLRHAAWFLLPRLLNAFGFVLIVTVIAPIQLADWLPLGAIYVVAGAIGILAFFVPSGLGVREGVIVALAAPIIGVSSAIAAAAIARLIATAADLLVATIAVTQGSFPPRHINEEVA